MHKNALDIYLEIAARRTSQRLGRRSFIAQSGNWILAILGARVLVPVMVTKAIADTPCGGHGDPTNKNDYCANTGLGAGSSTQNCDYLDKDPGQKIPCIQGDGCPKGTKKSTQGWTATVPCKGGGSEQITYTDCCGDVNTAYCKTGPTAFTCPQSARCDSLHGAWCVGVKDALPACSSHS